jgi:hypothetical protein
MRLIGPIVRVQVQETSLKIGEKPNRRYDPAGLRQVPLLEINNGGVRGWREDSTAIEDVHHADHPQTKYRGTNGVSFGFTGHYRAMREHFADHLIDGIAGENILVDYPGVLKEADFGGSVVIVTLDGREIRLEEVGIAAPCVEFSRFSLRFPEGARPDGTVTRALQFLHDGMRGFYSTYRGEPLRIAPGDLLYAAGND